jgi:hypothetical protein
MLLNHPSNHHVPNFTHVDRSETAKIRCLDLKIFLARIYESGCRVYWILTVRVQEEKGKKKLREAG